MLNLPQLVLSLIVIFITVTVYFWYSNLEIIFYGNLGAYICRPMVTSSGWVSNKCYVLIVHKEIFTFLMECLRSVPLSSNEPAFYNVSFVCSPATSYDRFDTNELTAPNNREDKAACSLETSI